MKKIILFIIITYLISTSVEAKKYKGAEIRTNESFLYGKFEVKMKSINGSGMLMSFFTFYDNPDFAKNWNEIDIEILGRFQNEVQFNSITAGPNGRLPHEKRHVLDYNPHVDFHLYGFEWTPTYIAFFVDGQEVYRQSDEWVKTMNRKQKIMMNIWPSEFWEWTGPMEAEKLPLFAMYDYVKYYEYNPSTENNFKLSWEDSFDKIDHARWSFATHTFDGNACDFDPDYAKTKDGYLILALENSEMETKPTTEIFIEDKSKERAMVYSATLENENTIKLSFGTPVNRVNAKKENFKIEGVEIMKVKFAMDMTNVELVTTALDISKTYELQFTAPGQTGEIFVQKLKLTKK